MFALEYLTPPEWVQRVEERPLELLADHAHCELKAAASAQSAIARNPERGGLVTRLAEVAVEEMEHFAIVVGELHARGGSLTPQVTNPYAEGLHARSAGTRSDMLLDRLLIAQLIEARSLERFHLLATHLADRELAQLYRGLMASEASHQALFGRFAREFFPAPVVERREEELRTIEAELVASLPFEYRVHSGAR